MPQDEPASRFTVPLCPSSNNLFVDRRDGKGRARSSAYKKWIEAAAWQVRMQFPPAVRGAVRIEIGVPINRQGDIMNREKAAIDLIVALGIIDDDRWVDDIRLLRSPKGNGMTVSIWPLSPPQE